jgi:transposase
VPTKSGAHFLAFLATLVAAYAGRKVRLVCDNGRLHTTRAVRAWLEANRESIEVYWLPPYCPSLNRIVRLWGHLKRTALADVLFATIDDPVRSFRKGVTRVNGRRERMGLLFRQDRKGKQAA